MTLKVTIFGAGAVGSVLAAQLARAGHQTSLIARGAHLHALQQDGLRYSAAQENFSFVWWRATAQSTLVCRTW